MAKGVNIPLTISGLREAREDLAKLKEEIKKTEDVKASQKLTKQYNELSTAIDDTTESLKEMNAAGELAGTRFDDLNEVLFQTNEEVLPLTSQIGEMEDRMYQLAQANQQGSKEFITLQQKVVAARKTIIETDRSIDAMTENVGSLGGITSAFGELGEAVFNLDFKRAGVAVKGLSTQFKAFGKVLLANPIFLIVAIVAAIVGAIITFKDKVKFLSDIFEALGKVIDVVIQALKDFLDWIGLTNFAEQDLAAERQKRAEENLENIKAQGDAVQSQFDRQIALAQAEGKSTFELEKKKQEAIIKTAEAQKAQLVVLTEQLRVQGKLTEEETKKIKAQRIALEETIKTASNNIKILEINNSKKIKEEEKKDLDTRQANYEKYKSNRETAARLLQDLELQLMEEGTDKEIASVNLKYNRLIEDTLSNENLLQNEKEQIIKDYESLRALEEGKILTEKKKKDAQELAAEQAKIDAINKYQQDAEQAQLDIIEGFQEEAYQLLLTDQEREEEAIRTKYENQLSLARQFGQDTAQIEEAFAKEKAAMEDKYRKEKLEKDQAVEDAKLDLASSGLSAISQLTELFAGKNEKAAKRAFQVQKAVSIAQAVIDTYKGANAIFASAAANPQSILFPAQPFITAGIAIASGIANVAKIAQTKFEGSSTPSASSPSAPSLGGGGTTSASASTPSFELFGQPNEDNNVSAAQAQELTPTVVKAVVVESDITTTQNKVSKMKENAEL